MLTRGRKSVMAPGDDSTNSSASGGTYSKMTGSNKPSITTAAVASTKNHADAGAGASTNHAVAANTSCDDGTGLGGVGVGMPSLSERLLAEQELHFQKQRLQQQQQQQSLHQQKQQSNNSIASGGTKAHQSVISSGTMSKKKKILSSPPAVSSGEPSPPNSTGSAPKNIEQRMNKKSEFSMHEFEDDDNFGTKITVSGRMDNSYYTNNNSAIRSQASKVTLTQKLKRATPFKHSKRTMNMVYAAFGHCTKKEDVDFDDESTMNLEAGDFEKQALMYTSGGSYLRKQQQMKRHRKMLQFVAGFLLFAGVIGMIRRRHGTHGDNHSDPSGMLSILPLLPTSYTRVFPSGKSVPTHIVHQAVFPPYFQGLSNLTTVYNPDKETPYFWDIHFSGESIAEAVFGHCHGLILACEFGLRQPEFTNDVSFRLTNSHAINWIKCALYFRC